MNTIIPSLSKQQVDVEIAMMREQSKTINATKESALASLIRAGLFTKSGRPKKRFYGDNVSVSKK